MTVSRTEDIIIQKGESREGKTQMTNGNGKKTIDLSRKDVEVPLEEVIAANLIVMNEHLKDVGEALNGLCFLLEKMALKSGAITQEDLDEPL